MWRLRAPALLLLLGGCQSLDDEVTPPKNNTPPEAALRVPVIAPLGVPVSIDASASLDPDGEPLTFVFSFTPSGETVSSAEPLIQHAFAARGVHSVLVRVLDLRGAEGLATQDISVRDEYPDPPDFCAGAEDCVVGDECEAGVCYVTGGTIE